MCWNKDVSLNTFIFSFSILLLIMYNNAYTKYKIKELNDIWMYLLLFSFIIIQFIEYFIWLNIDNPYYNNVFTICDTLVFIIQPIMGIMIIKNKKLRNFLLYTYLLLAIPFSIYQFNTINIYSVISEKGHLSWKSFNTPTFGCILWLFFFLFGIIYEKKWIGIIFGIITLIITYLNYKNDNTIWSMWCWSINSIAIEAVQFLIW